MRKYLTLLGVAVASVLLSSCGRTTTERSSPPVGDAGQVAAADKVVQAGNGDAAQDGPEIYEPTDPLAAEAQALPVGKVRIELTRSAPAGAAGEQAEYEWTILSRTPLARLKPLRNMTFPKGKGDEARWHVLRLTARVEVAKRPEEPSAKDKAAAKPDARYVSLDVGGKNVFFLPGQVGGSARVGGHAAAGTSLTLALGVWPAPLLQGKFTTVRRQEDLLEVPPAPLDETVKPLFRGPETLDPPRTLELLQIGDRKIALKITP
jgi:hypothetical protein